MNKENIADQLASRLKRERSDVDTLIKGFASALQEALVEGDTVLLPGFGTFVPVKEDEKVVTDLSTGERLLLPPAITIEFNPSSLLRRKITEQI